MAIVNHIYRESGAAMLEVLISILVLSFGLLGVAALQLAGIRSNQTAYLRSVATTQAYDMADRMRANMAAVTAADPNNYNAVTATTSSPSCASSFTATGGCTPTEMRDFDVNNWFAANAAMLPGGTGSIAKVANSNAFNISVSWTEKCQSGETGCTSGSLTRSFVTQFVP